MTVFALGRRLACFGLLAVAAACAAAEPAESTEFRLPPAATLLPSGIEAADARFVVSHIVFDGNRAVASAELDALAAPLVGRALSRADIEGLRRAVTQLYIVRGYVNSGAAAPVYDGAGGELRLRIVEGRLDEVQVEGLERLQPAYVADRLAVAGETFDVNLLQDRIRLLLGDPLLAQINAQVIPGVRPGEAVLNVKARESLPYRLAAVVNNYRPPAVGAEAAGLEGELRNLTGRGDILSLGVLGATQQTAFGAAWKLPLTAAGAYLQLRYDRGNSAVVESPLDQLDIDSRSNTREALLAWPLANTLRRSLFLGAAYAERESRTTLLGMPFAFSAGAADGATRTRDLRLFQEYLERGEQHAFALRSTFTFGDNNATETPGIGDQPRRRYAYWTGQGQGVFPLSARDQIVLRGTLQRAAARLVSLGQFALGGVQTVRGYRENQIVRDEGWSAGVEYRVRLPLESAALAVYPFADYGAAWNKGEAASTLRSVGVGLQWSYAALDSELVLASRLKDAPVPTSGDLQDRGVHFQLRYRFF